MIIFLRGHIRNAFENADLYNLIDNIKNFHKTPLKIYIHTWNIFSSDLSWRKVRADLREVKKHKIMNYFGSLRKFIKEIIIENDKEITINGEKEGYICDTLCPIISWKNMWHGIYTGIKFIKDNNPDNEYVINLRFDILNNSFPKDYDEIMRFVHANRNIKDFKENIFTNNNIQNINHIRGIDNFYVGNVKTMYILTEHFYSNLDTIILKYPQNKCQESLVYLENKLIFRQAAVRDQMTV